MGKEDITPLSMVFYADSISPALSHDGAQKHKYLFHFLAAPSQSTYKPSSANTKTTPPPTYHHKLYIIDESADHPLARPYFIYTHPKQHPDPLTYSPLITNMTPPVKQEHHSNTAKQKCQKHPLFSAPPTDSIASVYIPYTANTRSHSTPLLPQPRTIH